MPFSDPMADGPAIQASSQRALKSGQTMQKDAGHGQSLPRCRCHHPHSANGLLQPHIRVSGGSLHRRCGPSRSRRSDRGRHAARGRCRASSRRHRGGVELHSSRHADDGRAAGFLPCSPIHPGSSTTFRSPGITGTAAPDIAAVGAHVGRIKAHTDLPIAVGFGVKTEEQVSALARLAEGVVVGSALVAAIAQSLDEQGKATRNTKPQVLGLVERLARGAAAQGRSGRALGLEVILSDLQL